jgi:hypothetical protein
MVEKYSVIIFIDINTHTGTLDYFINDKHIKDRVVNVPKDVLEFDIVFVVYIYLFI